VQQQDCPALPWPVQTLHDLVGFGSRPSGCRFNRAYYSAVLVADLLLLLCVFFDWPQLVMQIRRFCRFRSVTTMELVVCATSIRRLDKPKERCAQGWMQDLHIYCCVQPACWLLLRPAWWPQMGPSVGRCAVGEVSPVCWGGSRRRLGWRACPSNLDIYFSVYVTDVHQLVCSVATSKSLGPVTRQLMSPDWRIGYTIIVKYNESGLPTFVSSSGLRLPVHHGSMSETLYLKIWG
jgi:hypothetical protein